MVHDAGVRLGCWYPIGQIEVAKSNVPWCLNRFGLVKMLVLNQIPSETEVDIHKW